MRRGGARHGDEVVVLTRTWLPHHWSLAPGTRCIVRRLSPSHRHTLVVSVETGRRYWIASRKLHVVRRALTWSGGGSGFHMDHVHLTYSTVDLNTYPSHPPAPRGETKDLWGGWPL